MHLRVDQHIYAASMHTCTLAAHVQSPAVSVSAITVREYPAGALTHSINLSLFDRNYVHLFSHSPHADTQAEAQRATSGFRFGRMENDPPASGGNLTTLCDNVLMIKAPSVTEVKGRTRLI